MSNQAKSSKDGRFPILEEAFTLFVNGSLKESGDKLHEYMVDVATRRYREHIAEEDFIPSEKEIDHSDNFDDEINYALNDKEASREGEGEREGDEENTDEFASKDKNNEEQDVEERVEDVEERMDNLEQRFKAYLADEEGDGSEEGDEEDDEEGDGENNKEDSDETNMDGDGDNSDVSEFSFNNEDDEGIKEATKLQDKVKDPTPGEDDSSNNKTILSKAPKKTSVSSPPGKGEAKPVRQKVGGDGNKGDNKPKDNTPSNNINVKPKKFNTSKATQKGDR